MKTIFLLLSATVLAIAPAMAAPPDLQQSLSTFVHDFDVARYQTPAGDARANAIDAMRIRAVDLEKQYPDRAEPMVLEAWALLEYVNIVRTLANIKNFAAARDKIEKALTLDPNVYGDESYATLGEIYIYTPSFLIGLGGEKKGRAYLEKALALYPAAARPNLSYAKYLLKIEDYAGAVKCATAALQAPLRPGRDKADAFLRSQAAEVFATANAKLRK